MTADVRGVKLNYDYAEKLWRVGSRDEGLALAKTQAALDFCKHRDEKFQYRLVTAGELREEREWSYETEVSASSLNRESRFMSDLSLLCEALNEGAIDFFVEDLSRCPYRLPSSTRLAAVLPRGDAREVLVLRKGQTFDGLPWGERIAADGLRRAFLLGCLRPDLLVSQSSGSVYQMLDQVLNRDFAGCVLPADDLLHSEVAAYTAQLSFFPFTPDAFCPAPGQGLMGLIAAAGAGRDFAELIQLANDPLARQAYHCESRIAARMTGQWINVSQSAAAHVYNKTDGTAMLIAVNTRSDKDAPLRVHLPLSYQGRAKGVPAMEQAAMRGLLGHLAFVGGGPGPAELLTIRARRLMEQADVLIYDDPQAAMILAQIQGEGEQVYVGPQPNAKAAAEPPISWAADEALRVIKREVRGGKNVVRLTIGDPWFYSPAVAETLGIAEAGLSYEIVPGVSALNAAADFAGIPLTLDRASESVRVMNGLTPLSERAYRQLAEAQVKAGEMLVFLQPITRLPEIARGLQDAGLDGETPTLLISLAGLSRQKPLDVPLRSLAARAVEEGILPPATLYIGSTVQLARKLRWWPPVGVLSGKTLIIGKSRSGDQLADLLHRSAEIMGAVTVELELVQHKAGEEIRRRLDSDFKHLMDNQNKKRLLERSDLWFVLTSGHAVEAFQLMLCRSGIDLRSLAKVKFAVYGDSALDAIRTLGFRPDFVPDVQDMEHLAAGLSGKVKRGDTVAYFRGSMGDSILGVFMQMVEVQYVELIAYETSRHPLGNNGLISIYPQTDFVVLTSPAAVHAYFDILADAGLPFGDKALGNTPVLVPAVAAAASALSARGYGSEETFPKEYSVQAILSYLANLAGTEEGKAYEQSPSWV